ncbi:MAG: hypothetical protein J6T10_13990 [Methanobrevibacter sp.]|nr:hypothetical protein [Methanobrevibacter sp.]
MNLTDDYILKFQKGTPILLDDICAIYPSKVGEIVDLGYSIFEQYLSLIVSTKPSEFKDVDDEFKKMLEQLTDFEYILFIANADLEFNQKFKEAFFFFTHEQISFSIDPAQIVVGPLEEKHILTEEKFYDLQQIIRRMFFLEQEGEDIIINKDDDPRTREIKLKLKKSREMVRKAKAKQAAREKSDLKFSDLIGSITINHCNLSIGNIWNITYYAFHDQLKRMGWRDQFNINNQAALAGAKLKKNQLKHWMRSIANSDKN